MKTNQSSKAYLCVEYCESALSSYSILMLNEVVTLLRDEELLMLCNQSTEYSLSM
jgi:hypothetical protein